ncbi:PRD domain-containing protein [Psychrobacillus sp. FSL K6-2365]|jgi:PRD domain protein (TIGR03582 family)|uniref:PRD domain-containing protein n=1 Tax=Psychrobacillus TaxID=1221880 RepID=UPI0008ECAC13|nr:PRD domain-containing protein [Psychrobacillus psychrodurans]MCZ8540522.1 PRD domain-containing protein [Psychrobacillus psychrodurans]SFM68517.1 PRD domain protein EF_0829/AHA_3910 [Psychrobacillus psychrodurans]
MNTQNLKEQEIISKSGNPDLCIDVLTYSKDFLESKKVLMTVPQWLSFVSHISGMVYRSTNEEPIQSVEKEIFNEVSSESIEMASEICKQLSNLHEDEKYLLSIHFEAAKLNEE